MFKSKVITLFCASILSIGGIITTNHYGKKRVVNARNTGIVMNHRYNAQDNIYRKKHTKVIKKILKHEVKPQSNPKKNGSSTSANQAMIAQNHALISDINPTIKYFFQIYYNYNSHDSYVARAKNLNGVATNAVLKNNTLFDDDGGSNQNSNVNYQKLESSFDSATPYIISRKGNNVNLIVVVTYDSKSGKADWATGEKWFNVKFNTAKTEITGMTSLYRQQNVDTSGV